VGSAQVEKQSEEVRTQQRFSASKDNLFRTRRNDIGPHAPVLHGSHLPRFGMISRKVTVLAAEIALLCDMKKNVVKASHGRNTLSSA